MNTEHLNLICKQMELGSLLKPAKRVYGGLIHTMWRIDTDKGCYAIKQLSKDVDLKNDEVVKNYELSEQIASRFVSQGIPVVSAIYKADKYLLIIDGVGYLVYPWVDAKALSRDEIVQDQALIIAGIVAKMHLMNLQVEEISEPECDFHDNDYIVDLINLAIQNQLPFSSILKDNLLTILEINENYVSSIEILKSHTVVGHGDLDQKNVLWTDKSDPLLIDWESARKLNPTYEMINVALDWSGVTTDLDTKLFHMMIKSYVESGGSLDKNMIKAAFYGVMGNWINWMIYNINRVITKEDHEQKAIGVEQVMQVLPTILRVKTFMPELINEIR